MKRVATSSLVLVGIVCLRYFLSFSGKGGGGGNFVHRVGQPDEWLVWQGDANGSDVSFHLFRWSIALGTVALIAFYSAFRVHRWKRPPAVSSEGHER